MKFGALVHHVLGYKTMPRSVKPFMSITIRAKEQGAIFRHFCVSKVITTAHAHKSGVILHYRKRGSASYIVRE